MPLSCAVRCLSEPGPHLNLEPDKVRPPFGVSDPSRTTDLAEVAVQADLLRLRHESTNPGERPMVRCVASSRIAVTAASESSMAFLGAQRAPGTQPTLVTIMGHQSVR